MVDAWFPLPKSLFYPTRPDQALPTTPISLSLYLYKPPRWACRYPFYTPPYFYPDLNPHRSFLHRNVFFNSSYVKNIAALFGIDLATVIPQPA